MKIRRTGSLEPIISVVNSKFLRQRRNRRLSCYETVRPGFKLTPVDQIGLNQTTEPVGFFYQNRADACLLQEVSRRQTRDSATNDDDAGCLLRWNSRTI